MPDEYFSVKRIPIDRIHKNFRKFENDLEKNSAKIPEYEFENDKLKEMVMFLVEPETEYLGLSFIF